MTDAEVIELIREIARLRNKVNTQSRTIDFLEIENRSLIKEKLQNDRTNNN